MLQMPKSIYHFHLGLVRSLEVIKFQAFYWVIMKIRHNGGEKPDSNQAQELLK